MITKNVKLYLTGGFPVRIPVSQFDTMWQFVFTIIKDGLEWTIPTGASAVLNGLKPDGNVFACSGTISGNTVTVDADVQMTAVAGDTICELSILATEGSEESQRGKVVGTTNFVLAVEAAPKSPNDVSSDSTLPAYAEMLEMFSGDIEDEVDNWLNAHSSQIGGLTNEAKQALLTLLAHVAYTDDQGQTYLDALEAALYPPVNLVSISAVFTQGSAVIYDTDGLDVLRQYLTVTATYSDSTTGVVTTYTLSGVLAAGTSTITVSYGGKTDTFSVSVTAAPTYLYNWDFTESLVDKVQGREAALFTGTTRASSGVILSAGGQGISLGEIAPAGKTFEFDVASFNFAGSTSTHIRFFMNTVSSSTQGIGSIIWRSGNGWSCYGMTAQDDPTQRSWGSNYISGTSTDVINAFNGKTVKIVFGTTGTASLYIDDVLQGTETGMYFGPIATVGRAAEGVNTSGNQCFNMTISAIRVYENEVA